MFLAPDFPDANGNATYILMTVTATSRSRSPADGHQRERFADHDFVNTIYSPDPSEPYMFDPRPSSTARRSA